jgi:hypothetical protein
LLLGLLLVRLLGQLRWVVLLCVLLLLHLCSRALRHCPLVQQWHLLAEA